jgi:hypothetical protein
MYNLTVNWSKEWIISRYESPWGIFQKFKSANEASDTDVLKLFGVDYIKELKSFVANKKYGDLVTMEFFDSKELKKYLGCDIKTLNKKNLNKIFNGKTNPIYLKYLIRNTLHYCPKCMEFGFHSIFHQLKFLDECPFHNINLVSICPQCHKELPYELNKMKSEPRPFHCLCGYSISNDDGDFYRCKNKWSQSPGLRINSQELNIFFNLTNEQKDKIHRIYINSNFLKEQYPQSMNLILSVIDESYIFKNGIIHNKAVSPPIIKKIDMKSNSHLTGDYYDFLYQTFRIDIFRSLRNTYKSITKHIRNRLLVKHRSCIKNLIRDLVFEELETHPICPFAYSYIVWRFYIERLDKPDQVDRIKPIRWLKQDIEILPKNEFDIITDLANQLRLEFRNILGDQMLFEWVINRLFILLVNNNFINILMNVSKGLIDQNLSKKSEVVKANIPFFLIVFPDNPNDSIEFHWWTNSEMDIDELAEKLTCPNSSVRKRRKDRCNSYSSINLYDRLNLNSDNRFIL